MGIHFILAASLLLAPTASLQFSVAARPRPRAVTSMGLTIRPYDKLLNKAAPVLVPLLVGYGSKVFKPVYKIADKVFNRKADTPKRAM